MKINMVHNEDCVVTMQRMPDNFIDLTVTSPPYDNLRSYHGYSFDFKSIATELYRVTKEGGVLVWIVGDATVQGNETGTSFRQALAFKDLGFNLLDTMIYSKGGQGATGSNKAYWQDFEYIFVLTKGRLRTFNPIMDRENKTPVGTHLCCQGHRNKCGTVKGKRIIVRRRFGKRFNIWKYHEAGTRVEHPAVFPGKLAEDCILTWSNPRDLVFDPFMGSGTTALMALKNNRRYLGSEVAQQYCRLIEARIQEAKNG
jgi:site-specific DNA-methyltransferase (adenine-specific)